VDQEAKIVAFSQCDSFQQVRPPSLGPPVANVIPQLIPARTYLGDSDQNRIAIERSLFQRRSFDGCVYVVRSSVRAFR